MKHGIVISKKIDKTGHVLLDVQSSRAGVVWSDVVVSQPTPGTSQSIEEGWHVAVEECEDGLMVMLGVLNTEPELLPDDLNASERSMKMDDGTEISVRKNDSGDYDVRISASGDLYIGDEDGAEKVAKQGHTHDYSWGDSGGSGTTDTPNEPGTETAVE